MATLTVYKAGRIVSQLALNKKLISLGRSSKCDLVLPEKEVSGLHCNVMLVKDRYQVVDLESTNGTLLNGKKIKDGPLKHNDMISVGGYLVKFETEDSLDKTVVIDSPQDLLEKSQKIVREIRGKQLTNLIDKPKNKTAGEAIKKSLDVLDTTLNSARRAQLQFKTILSLAEEINSAKGFKSVLEVILNAALNATTMQRGVIVLFDENGELQPAVWVGMEKDFESEGKKSISFTVVKKVLDKAEIMVVEDAGADKAFDGAESIVTHKIRATIGIPLKSRNKKTLGALYLDSKLGSFHRDNTTPEFLRMFSLFTATAIETRQSVVREKSMSEELAAVKEREKYSRQLVSLEKETKRLTKTGDKEDQRKTMGNSPAMKKLDELLEKVGPVDVPILITGETGTGKSLLASRIHDMSARRKKEFVTIDCASIPSELLESELFGHERGAFTGAVAQKKGRIEMAIGGTLFLDEIGDMSLKLQAKLLRFLQDKSFERVGGTKTLSLEVRIIAATNKDLKGSVAQRLFREDLYYRLCGVTLHMPPLRDRGDDVVVLANAFLKEACDQNNLVIRGFTPEAKNALVQYNWPGNIRQLKNVIQRAAILGEGDFIKLESLGLEPFGGEEARPQTLKEAREDIDKKIINQQLMAQKGNLSKVARVLGIDRGTLRELLKKYELGKD